jgi:hypothetical protein
LLSVVVVVVVHILINAVVGAEDLLKEKDNQVDMARARMTVSVGVVDKSCPSYVCSRPIFNNSLWPRLLFD